MAAALALLSSLLWGSADFLGGLLTRGRPAIVVVALSQAAGLVAVGVVAVVTGAWRGPAGWLPWSVVAGVSGALALVSFYRALSIGTMGIVSPIAALGVVVPVGWGLVRGESPSALQVAGMGVAAVGILAASGPELAGRARGPSVALAALAGLGFGVTLLAIGGGAATSPVMTLVGMRATSVMAFAVLFAARRTAPAVGLRQAGAVAAVGVADVAANLCYALASTRGLVSVVVVIASLYPVVTVLLARIVLRERLLRIQQAGVVAALGGVVLLAAG